MKVLLVDTSNTHVIKKCKLNNFDYVFELSNDVSKNDLIALGASNNQFSNEEEWGPILKSCLQESRALILELNRLLASESDIGNHLKWRNTSLWWFTLITKKDPEVDNRYFYSLAYILFIKRLLSLGNIEIEVATEDFSFHELVKDNFAQKVPCIVPSFIFLKFYLVYCMRINLLFRSLIVAIFSKTIAISMRSKSKHSEGTVYFESFFPQSFVRHPTLQDRHLGNIPELKSKQSVYLVNLQLSAKHILHPKMLKKDLDRIQAHYPGRVEWIDQYTPLLQLLKAFLGNIFIIFFKIDAIISLIITVASKERLGINLGPVVRELLIKSFVTGVVLDLQKSFLRYEKFGETLPVPHIFVNYSQMHPYGRSMVAGLKFFRKHSVISIQHAMESSSKINQIFSIEEVSQNTFEDFVTKLPAPDYFAVQGEHFKNLLKSFYPEDRITIVGSGKYESFHNLINKESEIRTKVRDGLGINQSEQLVLLCPSVNDIDVITQSLSLVKNRQGLRFLVKPHPLTVREQIQKSCDRHARDLNIAIVTDIPLNELMLASDLAISSYSTAAIEATFFNIPSVRVTNYRNFDLFDADSDILLLNNARELALFLERVFLIPKHQNNVAGYYFYLMDGDEGKRFWNILDSINFHL